VKRLNLASKLGYVLIALVGILGVYIAYRVYCFYPSIAHGFVGIAAIYYSFRYNLSPRKRDDQPADLTIEFPKGLQYLVYAFVLTLALSWAGFQTVDMVLWIVKAIK